MARRETHEQDCIHLLGEPYPEVHAWLDAKAVEYPPPVYLEYHRKFRHTEEALEEKFEEWGHYQQMAAKIHIIRDCELYVLSKPFEQVEIEEIDGLFEKAKQYLHW